MDEPRFEQQDGVASRRLDAELAQLLSGMIAPEELHCLPRHNVSRELSDYMPSTTSTSRNQYALLAADKLVACSDELALRKSDDWLQSRVHRCLETILPVGRPQELNRLPLEMEAHVPAPASVSLPKSVMRNSTMLMRQTFQFAIIVMIMHSGCKKNSIDDHLTPEATLRARSSPDLSGQKTSMLVTAPQATAARAAVEWFYKDTGGVVELIETDYTRLYEDIMNDIRAKESNIDIFTIWYPDLGRLVNEGALADITDIIATHRDMLQPEDFARSIYDPYTLVSGRRWALPFDGDIHVLFYRESLFSKYQLSPPTTWDEYESAARIITENERGNGIYGAAIIGSSVPVLLVSTYLNRLGGYGGQLLTSNGKPALDSPEALAALEALVRHSEYALPTPLETNFEASRDSFLTGRVAMVEQWTDIGVMAEDRSRSMIVGDWGVIQMPKGNGPRAAHRPALNAGYSLGVSARATNPEVAREFLLYITRANTMLRYNTMLDGTDPTRISVLTSKEYRSFAPQISVVARAALQGAIAWPNVPETPKLMHVLTENLTLALTKHKRPEQALADTQDAWLAILSEAPAAKQPAAGQY
ncbi:MAG: sugar ABC transporter substrate-binding protein [Proteobacteria bacterium]|nr:sugar ABC transporter substrate-binding protein [Pseudomonadota bacterium]